MMNLLLLSRHLSWRHRFSFRMAMFTSSATSHQSIDTESEASSCWSCSQLINRGSGGLSCEGCSKLQPVASKVEYYALMGLGPPMRYDIDLSKLESQYKRLQWLVHPDLGASRSEEERRYGAAAVLKLNEAFSVLKNPLLRARYLLHRRGGGPEADEAEVVSDATFLTEVMDAREAVEDASQDVPALEGLLKDTQARAGEVIQALGGAFEVESGSVDLARELTNKLTYLSRLEEEIRGKLPTSYEQ